MGVHVYHDALPGFDALQIWYDGCPECENRGDNPIVGMATLDRARFARAWRRAFVWNADGNEPLGQISRAERPLLELLWRMQVVLERNCGTPIGTLPMAQILPEDKVAAEEEIASLKAVVDSAWRWADTVRGSREETEAAKDLVADLKEHGD